MIEEMARVRAVEGNRARVERVTSSCGTCPSDGCGNGLFARALGAGRRPVMARNLVHAAPGELVVVGLSESALLRGSFIVYLLPVAMLLAGAALGEELAGGYVGLASEAAAVTGGLVGIACGLAWARRLVRSSHVLADSEPVIIRRAHESALPERS